jgi:hypothetical protein
VHELIGPNFAEKIFHDFAGWIMMPLALSLLGLEAFLLSKLFPEGGPRPVAMARSIASGASQRSQQVL